MHLAPPVPRALASLVATLPLAFALSGTADADRLPLLGPNPLDFNGPTRVSSVAGMIVAVNPDSVPCTFMATFEDVLGGNAPGTNYDGLLWSGGIQFAERFVGQTLSYNGNFDVVSGNPSNPLTLQTGLPGQNLDVFDYTTNVLTGLGPLGFPDIDAIGEGSMALVLPTPQSSVSFQLVGGNGGSATLGFYGADGSLIDNIVVSGLAEFRYGFATADGKKSITGILIQNTDPSGIGVDNICFGLIAVSAHESSWGHIKMLYH